MQNANTNNISDLISVLQEKAKIIREIEERAQNILKNDEPVQVHHKTIKQKAEVLSQLPEDAWPLIENLPRDIQSEVKIRLEEFAGNAEQALEVNSPFFMSMLLYPEDFQEGNNNDLEEFIQYLINNFT